LNFEGKIKGAKKNLIKNAELLCNKHSRSKEGVFDTLNRIDKTHGLIWIDTVFAVCPFLLWIGLEAERDDFIDESCFQMIKHHKILFDKEMKLYHQAIHFNKPDTLSPAHWARGAGWAAIALSELCCYLPEKHPEREKIFGYFHEFLEGCRNTQDNDGMWHQVMEKFETPDRFEPDYQSKLVNGELAKIMASYPESSGTALILYGMGRALEKEVVCWDEYGECYRKGLKALSGYVGLDGSVFNCCVGCCAPGNGTVEDYEQHPHDRLNNHGFGSVILAFSVAEALCSKELIPPLANIIGG
jgi:unsaturated rhamnogalacturonyl hydrolase